MKKSPTRLTLWGGRAFGFLVAGGAALGVEALGPHWLHGTARAVAAYDAAAVVLLASVWTLSMHRNAAVTKSRAAIDDIGRLLMFVIVLVSVVIGLAAAVVILGHGPKVPSPNEKATVYTLAVLAVVSGWTLIHTMYLFRYAHLFYRDNDNDGSADYGLDFPGSQEPNDYDFAYFSFVIGMTFQVSDVQIKSRIIRGVALEHALISFAYNTAIVAFGINILSGLLH